MGFYGTPLICASIASLVLLGACQGPASPADAVVAIKSDLAKKDYKSAAVRAKAALQADPQSVEARMLLGQALMETGDPQGAALELRKALELGAAEANAVPLLAKALLAQGQPQEVLQFAATHLDNAAASADLKTTVAAAFATLGQRDSALQAVQSALQEWPHHAPATLLYARMTAAAGNSSGAMALVEPLLAREPNNVGALILKGDLQRYALNDVNGALTNYRNAAVADPGSVIAHASILGLLLEQRDVAAAKTQFAQLKSAHPNHPETRLFEAQLALLDNDFAKAREIAELLLKTYPSDPRVLHIAAAAAIRLNANAQAEAYLGQAIKAAPQAHAPREMLAQMYLRSGQPQKALDVLQPILESSASATGLALAGQAHLLAGDLPRSEAAFARAAKIDPNNTAARMALALGQLGKGNAAAGFAALEAAAAAESGSQAGIALIAARLRSNDMPGALKAIDSLEAKQPDKPLAHLLRGNIQARGKDMAAARASFERALQLDPLYYPATAALAALDSSAGRPEAAKKRFEDLLRADPKNFRALLALAELKARSGASKDDVTKTIAGAAAASPNEPAPRLLLVNYLLNRRDLKAALEAAQNASVALPNNIAVLDQLGTAQLAAGQAQQAISTFARVAALRPAQPEPELRLASAHRAANDLDAAKRSFERALAIKPGLIPAEVGMAEVATAQKRYADALAIAHHMQRAQPKQASGYLLEAAVESNRGRLDTAVAALRVALPLDSGSKTAIQLHRTLMAAGRKDQADQLVGIWSKGHPQDAEFRYYLGDVAMASNDFAAAETHYRSVLEVQADNALALNNIAWLLTQQQKPGAVLLAERSNQLLPDQPALMDTLALALAADHQVARAIELQKKAISSAPDNAALRLTLAKIYLTAGDRSQARAELDSLSKMGDKFPAQLEVASLMKTL